MLSTLKTIFIDDLDDNTTLLCRTNNENDLLTNNFDEDEDINDQNSPFSSSSILDLFPPKTTSTSLDNDDLLIVQQPTLLSACTSHDSSCSSHSYSESGFCSSSLLSSSSIISACSSSPPQSSSPSILKRASSISIMPTNINSNNNNILSTSSPTCSNIHSTSSSPLTSYNNCPLPNHLLMNDSISSSSSSLSPQQQQQHHDHNNNNNNMQIFHCCPLCSMVYKKQNSARVLQCFHTICESCVDKLPVLSNGTSDGGNDNENENYHVNCPLCGLKTIVQNILPDYTIHNVLEYMMPLNETTTQQRYTPCKNIESLGGVTKCCSNSQRVVYIKEFESNVNNNDLRPCINHKNESLKYFCSTCNIPICKECTTTDHSRNHEYMPLNDAGSHQVAKLQNMVENTRLRLNELKHSQKTFDRAYGMLQTQYHKAQHDINETYNFYRQLIEERKHELIKELDNGFTEKQTILTSQMQKIDETLTKANQPLDFSDRLFKNSSTTEILLYKKQLENKLNTIIQIMPDPNMHSAFEIEFVSNFQAIQTGVRNTFGYVRTSPEMATNNHYKPRPIAPPITSMNNACHNHNHHSGSSPTKLHHQQHNNNTPQSQSQLHTSSLLNGLEMLTLSSNLKKYSTPTPLSFQSSTNDINPYELWSTGGTSITSPISAPSVPTLPSLPPLSSSASTNGTTDLGVDMVMDSLSNLDYSTLPQHLMLPSRPNGSLKRHKMIYHLKFGEFGVMEGQFTEPSGIAVNGQGDIIVADTNNHRIQVFDKDGRFRFQFGECGKREGQLLYPNRVAVFRQSGDIVVTERSPTHQIQIYNQYGQFIRKFGANVLQHPRGVCVDNRGQIIVVECKVMRIFIFDCNGNVLNKFTCSKYLEFPNGVCCNDKQEIFISDNRAHCIKVFSQVDGQFLRTIGSEGITNYPIGVVINSHGDVLVADNHNNFNITIFDQNGNLISALESKVKHAQCFDVALMDDGSVVLASKDYRVYVYRYLTTPGTNGVTTAITNTTNSSSPASPISSSSTTPQITCTSPNQQNQIDQIQQTLSTSNGYC